MKKKWFIPLIALCIVMASLPFTALASEGDASEAEAAIDGVPYPTLAAAVEAAESGKAVTVTLLKDITGLTTDQIINIPADKHIVLNMNGKSITVAESFVGRPIDNAGTLTVTGNGTIDSSMAEPAEDGGDGGYGAINNTGTLTIENGTFKGAFKTGAACIRNFGADAVLTIEDGTFDTACSAVLNYNGTAILNGGTYTGTSCSACNENIWAYTVRNYTDSSNPGNPRMIVNGGTYTGTQGAMSSSVGYLEVNDGTFQTVDCANKHGSIFYALYVAGERGKVQCAVNGGTFTTTGRNTAALLGNDNTNGDGGINAEASVHVYDGTFIAPEGVTALKVSENTAASSIIHGGTYSSLADAVYQYIAPECVSEESGNYTVIQKRTAEDDDAFAETGGKYYADLSDAIEAAEDGGMVTILKSITLTDTVTLDENKEITIDINGCTITGPTVEADKITLDVKQGTVTLTDSLAETNPGKIVGQTNKAAICVRAGASMTVENCSLEFNDTTATAKQDMMIQVQGTLVLESGAKISSTEYGVCVYGPEAKLTVEEGAEITAATSAISGNGQNNATFWKPQITINGGKITSTSATNPAIYHPQVDGQITINGGTITGVTGIEMRAGTLIVNGGIFTATAEDFSCNANGDGPTTVGAAIAIAQHTTKQDISVTINDGTFKGVKALNESNPQENDPAPQVALSITDGDFTGDVSVTDVPEDGFISGGAFSSVVSDNFCAPGFVPVTVADENGKYTVTKDTGKNFAAEVSNAFGAVTGAYEHLADAIEASEDGDTITLLTAEEQSLTKAIPEGVTLVVAEGQTLTVETTNAPTVLGSVGTLEIQAGGTFSLAGITIVGTGGALNLTSGSAEVVFSTKTMALKAGAAAEVADELLLSKTYVATATVESGATLTVSGKLTVPNDVTLTVNGALDVASGGLVRVNSQAALAGSGTVTNAGKITLHQGGSNTATVQPTITLTSGGEVYSQFALTDGKVASSSKSTGNYTVAGIVAEDGATLLTFTEKYTYYVPSTSGGSSGSTTYTITVSKADNGAVTVSSKAASKGRTVTITVKPDEGYALESLTVTDRNGKELELTDKGGGKYTFTMPASRVTVDALFAEIEPVHTCPAEKFTDVDVDDWFHEAVDYVVENGMMNGVSDTAFAPEATTTRGMIVTVLYRLEGNPKTGPSDFEDVASHAWYADSVAWACANGIVNGYGNGSFGPEDMITREQVATILYRYASYKGYDLTARADLSVYNDNNTVSGYAEAAMNWAVGEELFQGVGASLLSPSTSATRSQIATILMRFYENVAK